MHRQSLLNALTEYAKFYSEEIETMERIAALVRSHKNCFERACRPGHITSSAWILSADRKRCLMTHHRKLNRWLQLGGHTDGESDTLASAVREAQEESGMKRFEVLQATDASDYFDIDVHTIPARFDTNGTEIADAHEHHDIRYLLVARDDEPLQISDESNDLRWLTPEEVYERTQEESVLRLLRKAKPWMN